MMAVASDDDSMSYMRFQDLNDHGERPSKKRALDGMMEMDDLQMSLDQEEGTLRRKQRNMADSTVSNANDPSIQRSTSTLE